MAETRRQFSRAYKLEAVRLITEQGRTPGEVARELGVRADMLRRWKREAEAGSLNPVSAPVGDSSCASGKLVGTDD